MKTLYTFILFLSFVSYNDIIQKNHNSDQQQEVNFEDPFVGTWEWQNGNRIFRVFLWDDEHGAIDGHFEMVEVNNGVETTIYKSNKPYNSQTPQFWHPVISGGHDGKDFDGRILDNSLDYEAPEWDGYSFWHARLRIKILQSGNCVGCATTASWKAAYFDITPSNKLPLNIPTDIILTKVN